MAFEREVFPILETSGGQGSSASQSQAGDAAAGKRGLTAFGFRDSSGNLVLPQLTAAGKLAVDTGSSSGTCKKAFGKNATGSLTEVLLATISLTASKVYADIASTVSCTRTAVYRLVHNDNGVETELAVQIVGAGQFSHDFAQACLEFTAGATGTQELKLFGINLDKASQLSGTISCLERP
jgi:hypothetical protein